MLPLIAERKENPGDDLISKIVHAEIEGERLSDIEAATVWIQSSLD
jgi:cytochrome P450